MKNDIGAFVKTINFKIFSINTVTIHLERSFFNRAAANLFINRGKCSLVCKKRIQGIIFQRNYLLLSMQPAIYNFGDSVV